MSDLPLVRKYNQFLHLASFIRLGLWSLHDMDRPHCPFFNLDIVALVLLIRGVAGDRLGHRAPASRHPSVSALMAGFRREWMVQMVGRDPRIFDAQIVASMRQGTSFFASTCIIAIGGGLALIGNAERVAGLANELTLETDPTFVWEVKLLLICFL